jgi:hypothetical protein
MTDKARIEYPDPYELYRFLESSFDRSTEKALELSRHYHDEDIRDLLMMIEGAVYPDNPQSWEGASFKSLAYVAHQYGLSSEQRQVWYEVAKSVPLSQAHVSYITRNVQGRNDLISGVESMIEEG